MTAGAWIEELEDGVDRAIREIERLKEENARLREQVRELETSSGPATSEGWQEERDEVRDRVERMVARLQGLLEE